MTAPKTPPPPSMPTESPKVPTAGAGGPRLPTFGKLPRPFEPNLTAAHAPAHCLCTWTWTPALGGPDRPFAMKFRNRACPVRH